MCLQTWPSCSLFSILQFETERLHNPASYAAGIHLLRHILEQCVWILKNNKLSLLEFCDIDIFWYNNSVSGKIGNPKDNTPGWTDGGPGGFLRKLWSLQILLSVNNLSWSWNNRTAVVIYFMWMLSVQAVFCTLSKIKFIPCSYIFSL